MNLSTNYAATAAPQPSHTSSIDRCTRPPAGLCMTDEPATATDARGWTIEDLAQFMGVDWPPSDDAPALDTLAHECGDDRARIVGDAGDTRSLAFKHAAYCAEPARAHVENLVTLVDDDDDVRVVDERVRAKGAKGTHPCDSVDVVRPCKRARVEYDTETATDNRACAEGGCDILLSLAECTHGMCPAHCRRRQRMLGAVHGKCVHPMHAVVDWYRPCGARGCSGRAGVGCVKDLCAAHCTRAAAATKDARPCHSRSHRDTTLCLYRRRHAAARPRPTTTVDGSMVVHNP